MKYKTILLIVLLAFVVSLAVVVGQRLSSESMAVIVGVVAGVAASIPASLIVVWAAMRTRVAPVVEAPAPRRPEPQPEPRIVVVSPQPQAAPTYAAPAGPRYYTPGESGLSFEPAMPRPPARRQFTVIGGAGEEEAF